MYVIAIIPLQAVVADIYLDRKSVALNHVRNPLSPM